MRIPMKITYQPIGVIRSPFTDLVSMPIQPASDASGPGTIEIYAPFVEGLKDLDGFSHLILLCHLHEVQSTSLTVTPFLDSVPRGIFSTRAPARPNPIGVSVVKLIRIEGSILHVEDLDLLDGTPLLDLKPYVPEFDHRPDARIGWLESVKGNTKTTISDDRFQ
jgi:tRNA-Thr(GGU) m(6)t(6)A37 methyltransferase TsaA